MEENNNFISYDENWQEVSQSEYPVVSEPEENYNRSFIQQPKKKRSPSTAPKPLLVTLQLLLCVIVTLSAFVLKSIGGDWYTTVRTWYYSQLESSAIFDGNNHFDINTLPGKATPDEV